MDLKEDGDEEHPLQEPNMFEKGPSVASTYSVLASPNLLQWSLAISIQNGRRHSMEYCD